MTPGLTTLLVYSAQVLLVVAVAAVAAWASRVRAPGIRLWFWRGTLALCLLLPMVASTSPAPNVSVTFGSAAVAATSVQPLEQPDGWSVGILAVVVAGVVARLLWIAVGLVRLWHLRRTSTSATLASEDEALRQTLAPRARVCWTERLAQPVTFGLVRPVVLLPSRMGSLDPDARRAVLCHELVHVARRDWPWIVAENVVRAALWFHPAVWWLIDELQVSREQVVDRDVVHRTGARKAYMEALLWFTDTPATSLPATAFLYRRHLRARLRQLSEESPMRRIHLALATLAMVLVTGIGSAGIIRALPLDRTALGLAQGSQARLEIRLVVDDVLARATLGGGRLPAATVGSERRQIYLAPDAIVTTADVADARVTDAGGGRFSVIVRFTEQGSSRMAAATGKHIGRRVAIVLDGVVLAAPVVKSPIADSAVLTGDFTRAQAEAIVNRLPTRLLGVQVRPAPWASFSGVQPGETPQERPFTALDDGVTLPTVISETRPVYTQAAMDAKVQGVVGMAVVVTTEGTVGDVRVITSLDTQYGLDQAAVDAMHLWRFKPGTRQGQPVPVQVEVQMTFTLK